MMKKIKQVWISDSKITPSVRSVLFEKYTKDEEGSFMYINGVEVRMFKDEHSHLKVNKFGMPKLLPCTEWTKVDRNTLAFIGVFNHPNESTKTDSKILWKLSRLVFKAKAYRDSINNKIVINYL